MSNSKILSIGICCIDVVTKVAVYPEEDEFQRCISQWKQRGGNASNNATVLSLLGAETYYFGILANSFDLNFIKQDFAKFGINTDLAVLKDGYEFPNSCVILSKETGSRTIVHCNNNFPEITLEQFKTIDLHLFSWIHFEGRNIKEIPRMVQHIRDFCKKTNLKITISIELEKTKLDLESLIPFADVIFMSKDFAISMDWHNMEDAVNGIYTKFSTRGTVICPWGEKGAAAKMDQGSPIVISNSFPPTKIVDTLGAGDTFIAATIYALKNGRSLSDSIELGCRIAGVKIGIFGFEVGMKDVFRNIYDSML